MNKLKTTLLVLTTIATLNAIEITSQGYANNKQDSKKEALSTLSNKISVDVKSDFKTYTTVFDEDYKKDTKKLVHLTSNLPLKGVVFYDDEEYDSIVTTAILSSKNSLNSYIVELKRLNKNILQSTKQLKSTKNNNLKYNILNQLLKDIENFNKHKIVATLLEGKNLPTLNITLSKVKLAIQKLEDKIPSIKIASKLLTKNINKSDIYISAIKPSGSSQVTQFAKILKDSMSSHIDTVSNSSKAKYFLRGDYEILKNSIFVTLNLSDTSNNILETRTVTLDKQAYKDTIYKPSTKTFDESLNSGFVKSGKLSVNIGFKGYSRAQGIDLNDGDIVDIVVKTNKAMCYFLLGHTLKEDTKFSYVLPIGSDNDPYINQITGNDVNKNIIIVEEVPISAPFGSENLQIFSSTLKKNGRCPLVVPRCTEDDEGYCVVNGKPNNVIVKTRALNIKKKKFKVEKAEASVSFTSFGK